MKKSNKIILDLCGGTGAWSKPYKDAGYEVHVLTLPYCDVTGIYSYGTRLCFPYNEKLLSVPISLVYGILAAPPCTEFSLAKGSRPRDFEGGIEVVKACMNIIWHCRIYGNLKFWAMENPRGFLRQFMGKPAYTFEQWQFGTTTIKKTDIWGYFNELKPTVSVQPDNLVMCIGHSRNGRGWSKPVVPDEYKHLNLDRSAARAITPAGFAAAFFKANK